MSPALGALKSGRGTLPLVFADRELRARASDNTITREMPAIDPRPAPSAQT
jgi:hypothetical protein